MNILYHPEVFTILKKWLEMISDGSDWEAKSILNRAADIHPLLVSFLERNHFHEVWRASCGTIATPMLFSSNSMCGSTALKL